MLNRKREQQRQRGAAVAKLMTFALALVLVLSGCDMMGSSSGTTATATAVGPQSGATAANTTVAQAVTQAATAAPTNTQAPTAPPTETPIPPSPTPAPRTLTGKVTDQYSGAPVSGAQVTAGGVLTATNSAGQYYFEVVPEESPVQVEAPGYASAEMSSGSTPTLDIALRPTTIRGRVTNATTGAAVYGAIVRIDIPGAAGASEPTAAATEAVPAAAPTMTETTGGRLPGLAQADQPSVTAVAAEETPTTAAAVPTLTALPPTATATQPPIMPTPFSRPDMILAVTDKDGYYTLENVPADTMMTVKMPGYKIEKVQLATGTTKDVALTPFAAKALYMTANAAAYEPLFDPIMDLIDKTELNAIVINIQNDSAQVVYPTKIQMANDSDAVELILPDMKELVQQLHERGIYVIARMTTFMQPAVADANPDLSVLSKATGKPWIGGELKQQRWLDPTNVKSHAYPLALMREAAVDLGVDEVQLDYIRFPSDPAEGETWANMKFSQPADDSNKHAIIGQFLKEAHDMMNETDAFLSADIFGYTVWPDQPDGPMNAAIGQVFEDMAPYVDYISPMIYPSHFSAGEMGFDDPNEHPYEIIKQASIYTMERLQNQRAAYRPWLQGFDWYSGPTYDEKLYRVQIDAAEEQGATGWMFWDASNEYYNGFKPEP